MAPKQRGVAHVRLSADEEKALSRIVGRIASKSSSSGGEIVDKKQAEKKLRKIYDSLGNEGFTADQIELALAAISLSNATLESALDWLCLNIHPNDLPLKFSTGFTVDDKAGSVQVLASSQGDSKKSSEKIRKKSDFSNLLQLDAKDKRKKSNDNTDKDWIRQYVAQQEEDDEEDSQSDLSDWEEHVDGKFKIDPLDTAEKIAAAFFTAKQAAVEAKSRGDKQRQADAGKTIRDLKEKMLLLGLSEDDLVFPAESPDTSNDSPIEDQTDTVADHDSDNEQTLPDQNVADQKPDQNVGDQKPDQNVADKKPDQNEADQKPAGDKVDEDEDDLIGMFDEESAQTENIPQLVPQLPKKEKIKPWGAKEVRGGKTKLKTASIEAQKSPRAVLQQYCQKNGWEAPKFEKIPAKHGAYNYAITIFRPKVGRGKQKKIGGPATYSFPDDDLFGSISEAQDAAATWTLFSLFPQEPIHLELMEPFRSMWLRWHSQGKLPTEANSESRDDFIRSILDAEKPETSSLDDVVSTSESVAETLQAPATSMEHKNLKENYDHSASARLKLMLDSKVKDRRYQAMLSTRRQLPIASVKETILENLITSNILVVSGETGSGKTTQVPQFILDDMIAARQGGSCKIICTQPRRIAAISVAERVANERCEPAPGEAGSTVGYQVRLDASWTNETRLLFCTTGILLRRLASDRELSDVSHVVVDEVHERTVLGDFLISLLRDLVAKRNQDKLNPLKVILMSATLDADRFSQYFGDCPVVVATGRSYPVKTFYLEDIYEKLDYRLSNDNPAAMQQSYSSHDKKSSQSVIDKNRGRQNLALSGWGDEQILESRLINPMYDESLYQNYSENTRKNLAKLNEDVIDYELLEDLIMHINETGDPGALLVFLPGMPEILQLLDRLTVLKTFSGPASEWLLPLHSSVAPADQRKVFQVPRNGIRKIVLATNIAETSVTIEDVVHVIDCGKHKENRFDPRRRMSRMVEAWISQANARQRAGRAGRVKAGNCFCLYTQDRFSNQMHHFQLPEILRVPLVELCLQIKLLSVENVASFLEKALDPPKAEAVESALSTLREVGALTEEESLTPLGCHLAALPVDVHIGKMMLYGALLGCLSPILTIAAYLSHKSPFVAPLGQRDAAERAKHGFGDAAAEKSTIASGRQSDHLVIVAAYENWRRISSQGSSRAARQYCDANFLSIPVLNMLKEMRLQFAKLLKDIGFISKIDHQTLDRSLDDANQQFNLNAQSASVVKAVLCAGLYPNVATMMEESVKAGHANALNQRAGLASQRTPRWTDGRREVFVHPSSINSKAKEFQHPYLVFHEKVETSKVYLRDTTVLSPFALLLFGGSLKVQHQVGYATVDDWMKMDVPARTAVLFKELRSSLDSLLSELTKTPQVSSAHAKEVVNSVLRLLVQMER